MDVGCATRLKQWQLRMMDCCTCNPHGQLVTHTANCILRLFSHHRNQHVQDRVLSLNRAVYQLRPTIAHGRSSAVRASALDTAHCDSFRCSGSLNMASSPSSVLKEIDLEFPGLLGTLPKADLGLLASGAVVFGVQRLVPTYDDSWYKAIKKPTWTPPNWVFPAMWIPLKVLQSVSLWLVLKQADTKKQLILPLSLFGLHLFLGNWWNVVFFGRRKMQESVEWMGAFCLSIAGSIASFSQVSPLAAALFAPTQLWVTVAAKLNYDIAKLNSSSSSSSSDNKQQ